MEIVSPYYSIPYVIVLFLLVLLLWFDNNYKVKYKASQDNNNYNRSPFVFLAFLLLLFFIGLRGHLYSDYIEYYPFFNDIPDIFNFRFSDNRYLTFEPGYLLYTSITKTFISNYHVWVFFNTLVDLAIFYCFFKKYSESTILSFIVFFAFNGLIIEFNLYRNVKAMCLFLISIKYLEARNAKNYILLNLIGSFFHSTAILYIICYLFLHKTFSRFLMWGLFFLANILFITQTYFTNFIFDHVASLLNIDIISNKILSRLERADDGVFTFGYFERTISFILLIGSYRKLCSNNPSNKIFCNSFFLYYIVYYMFSDVKIFVERIPLLFIFSYWILYPNYLKQVNLKYRKILLTYIILLCLVKTVVGNRYFSAEYDNVIWGIKSYEDRSASQLYYYQDL